MKRGAVFQLRLSVPEAERLESQAKDAGLSKADLIRKALGWDITKRPTRTAARPGRTATSAAKKPDDNVGKAALEELRRRIAAG